MSESKEEKLSKLQKESLQRECEISSFSQQNKEKNQQHNLQQAFDDEYKLPESYDINRIVLQVRNPESIYIYWEYTFDKLQETAIQAGYEDVKKAPLILRVYCCGENNIEAEYYDINITLDHNDWYLYDLNPDHDYEVELGILNDEFYPILKSNQVTTPSNSISDKLDEEWMTVTEKLEEIYTLAGIDELESHSSENLMQEMTKEIKLSHLKTGYSSLEVLKNSDEVR